jgi:glycine oxidase
MPAQGKVKSLGTAEDRTAYEVVVVGAGAIGLSIAWRAAASGMRVLALDAGEPAGGATGVAAGMLAPVTEADFGEEELTALNLAGARMWPSFAAELEVASGVDCGYRRSGTLAVAVDRDDAELLRRLHDHQRALGLDSRWVSGRECRRLEPGLATRVTGGIVAPADHQVSPRALARALVAALRSAGGDLRVRSRVERVEMDDGAVVLDDGSRVSAGAVVIAAGAESGQLAGLAEAARVPVRPVKGQILRLRARPPVVLPARHVIRTPEVYAVPRDDGRLVVGATVEERGWDRAVTAGGVLELLRRAYEVLPGIAELDLVETAAGLRPATPDNGPVVGESAAPGVWWATGHWRNGVLLAPITAAAIVAMLRGGEPPPEFAPFAPSRFAAPAAAEVPR